MKKNNNFSYPFLKGTCKSTQLNCRSFYLEFSAVKVYILAIIFTSLISFNLKGQSQCTYFTLHGPQSECNGLNGLVYNAYSSNSASINVTWTPINGTVILSGVISNSESFAKINWNSGFQHSLICYDALSGCTDTLFLQTCCDLANATIIDLSSQKDLTQIQNLLGAPNTITLDVTGPRIIRIEGELELRNIDVSFDQCQFIMAPGSVIYLPGPDNTGSHTATFSNCTFRSSGCEKMWQGLFCPMEADVTFENSKIQDAEFGVKIYGKMTLNAFHTEFSRNYIGIFVPPTLASTDFGLGSILNDCKFDGGLPLYSTYYGQLPLPRGE